MIAELGHFALVIAFVLSVTQILLTASRRLTPNALQLVLRRFCYLEFAALLFSFLCLVLLFAQSDFSVALVFEHSHSTKPMIFKVAGAWGNHEGSILLWVLVLALFAAWAAGRMIPEDGLGLTTKIWSLTSQAWLISMFSGFVLWTSNPFRRLFPVPVDGAGLNPVLQDIGLAIHPPLLYVGYVGFSVVFAFAVGGLISGRIDQVWARQLRPLALVAWAFLTAGIALGSWWASYELGWGGWWFWDPVENLSLMPWLTGTAFIHSLLVLEKRGTMRTWTVFLGLLTFGSSMLGTFVVRSGILTSVHSFAVDPTRGGVILAIVALSVGIGFVIFAVQAPKLPPGKSYGLVSREGAIVGNNLLLCSAFGAVFVGTFYPILAELLGGGRPSVGAPYYAATFNPMMLLLLVLMAVGPLLIWRLNTSFRMVKKRFMIIVLVAMIGSIAISLLMNNFGFFALAIMAVALSVATGAVLALVRDSGTTGEWWRLGFGKVGMALAHVGLAVSVIGMAGASLWVEEHLVALAPGEDVALNDEGWRVSMADWETESRSNHTAIIVPIQLIHTGGEVLTLRPERRQYVVRQEATTELDTARSLSVNLGLTDVFATLGQQTETGRMATKIVFRPLQIFLWLGAILMFLGGLMASFGGSRRSFGISA